MSAGPAAPPLPPLPPLPARLTELVPARAGCTIGGAPAPKKLGGSEVSRGLRSEALQAAAKPSTASKSRPELPDKTHLNRCFSAIDQTMAGSLSLDPKKRTGRNEPARPWPSNHRGRERRWESEGEARAALASDPGSPGLPRTIVDERRLTLVRSRRRVEAQPSFRRRAI